jgi:excisionase family DNA binding protein
MIDLADCLTVKQAGEFLKLSRQSVYRVARRCQWRTIRVGHARLFARADVEATPSAKERQRLTGKFLENPNAVSIS